MTKKIKLHLSETSDFFLEMKKELSNGQDSSVQFYMDSKPETIMTAIIDSFKDLAKSQGFKNSYDVNLTVDDVSNLKLSIESKIYNYFNRRFHTTTLERFSDFVENFIDSQVEKQINEKKIVIPELIDTEKEKELIKNYIVNNWNGFDKINSEEFFSSIWNKCLEKTKNNFNEYLLLDLIEQWSEERHDFQKWKDAGSSIKENELEIKLITEKDKIYDFPKDLLLSSMKLKRIINEVSYRDIVPNLLNEVKFEFPESKKLKPKGWSSSLKNYEEYIGMSNLDENKIKKEFGGFNSESAVAPGFEIRTSLPHVLYNHREQGYGPLETLVGSIYAHAYVLNEYNNNVKLLQEFSNMKDEFSKPEYFKTIVDDINFDFKESLSKSLFFMIKNKGNYNDNQIKSILNDNVLNNKTMKPNS